MNPSLDRSNIWIRLFNSDCPNLWITSRISKILDSGSVTPSFNYLKNMDFYLLPLWNGVCFLINAYIEGGFPVRLEFGPVGWVFKQENIVDFRQLQLLLRSLFAALRSTGLWLSVGAYE